MRIFISGGCKNGKSSLAERLAYEQRGLKPLYYIATMRANDAEDEARIARHRLQRAAYGFITVEQGEQIASILDSCDPGGSFLLDSLTALLAGAMFPLAGAIDLTAGKTLADDLERLFDRLQNLVIVSDFIYSDAQHYSDLSECFRHELAGLDRLAADRCERVFEVVAGIAICHKGVGS